MPKPFISVHNLSMDFDDTRVLNNVSFEIPEGEIIGVIRVVEPELLLA